MGGFLTADPQGFGDRHALAYRVAFRLTGDSGQAMEAAAHGLARADARLLPHTPLSRIASACRFTAERALATADMPAGTDAPHAGLRRAARALTTRQRDVFILAGLAELPIEDVARVLGVAVPWCIRQYRTATDAVTAASVPAPAAASAPASEPAPAPESASTSESAPPPLVPAGSCGR